MPTMTPAPGRCWFWLHRWTKWQTYRVTSNVILGRLSGAPGKPTTCTEERQRRTCLCCGRTQDDYLRDV